MIANSRQWLEALASSPLFEAVVDGQCKDCGRPISRREARCAACHFKHRNTSGKGGTVLCAGRCGKALPPLRQGGKKFCDPCFREHRRQYFRTRAAARKQEQGAA